MRELHSIVVPVFNEEAVVEEFYARATSALARLQDYEIIFVDDGSRDSTYTTLEALAARDAHVRAVRLARNFGQQTAITAGIDVARGDTVCGIDVDLQDPPELIPAMIEEWREGADVVFAVREVREGETWFKRNSAHLFYRLMRTMANVDIPLDASDFRLLSRRAADGMRSMRERSRYVRGLVAWLGMKRAYVSYQRSPRAAGKTKYSLKKMVHLAVDGMVSFSTKPLQMATVLGFAASALAFAYAVFVLVHRFTAARVVEGWTSLMIVVLFLGGVQLIALGIIGEYVGRIFDEVRDRPLYLVSDLAGFSEKLVGLPRAQAAEDGGRDDAGGPDGPRLPPLRGESRGEALVVRGAP